MSSSKLFEPYQLGAVTLSNRAVMAPLTRNRAVAGFVPNPLTIEYYGQARIGRLCSSPKQARSRSRVRAIRTRPASHQGAGRGLAQRSPTACTSAAATSTSSSGMSAASPTPRCKPMAAHPSHPPRSAPGKTFVGGTFADVSEPRALELSEIPGIIDSFKRASANALEAGFDGVEIHGANGYLLDQFAKDGTNKRTDAYGGSIENRARLMLEVSKAVAAEAGANRTGIRLSPVTPANDISDSNPQPLFDHIVDGLNALKLVYIHVIEGATGGPRDNAPFNYDSLRKRFSGTYIANNGYDFKLANDVLEKNKADLIAFGKLFISNPDLVERLKLGAPLNDFDKSTFYGGGAKGYTDYPALGRQAAAQ